MADVVVAEPVENDGNGVRLSLERSRSEHGVAVLAVPELQSLEFLSAFAFPDDLRAGAVEAALLACADCFFDWKFGHRGDALGVPSMVRIFECVSRPARHGYAGRHVTDLQVLGHGYWMPTLRVVELRICKGSGGFGRGGRRSFAVGWWF